MKTCIALVVVAFVSQQSATYLIDLTSELRSTDEEYFSVPAALRASALRAVAPAIDGPPRTVAPFEIVDLTFDKTSYTIGEAYLCSFTLRYVGLTSIMFPKETWMHLFRRSMPTLQVAAAQLVVEPASSSSVGWRTQVQEQLYGASDVADSLVPISPNATVRITTTGRWRFSGDAGTTTWPVQVMPRVTLYWSVADVDYAAAQSTAGPSITLSQP